MIKYIALNNNPENLYNGKAWPNYVVVDVLENGFRIIRNGIDRYVYALIDSNENLIISYTQDEISRISGTSYLKFFNHFMSKMRLFDISGREIISSYVSSVQTHDNVFIVSKSNNEFGRNEKQLFGIYSNDGTNLYPIEYNIIEIVGPNIYRLTKLKDGYFNSSHEKNFLWFAKLNKTLNIPCGRIDLLNNGLSLFIHPNTDNNNYSNSGSSQFMLISSSGEVLSPERTIEIGTFNEDGFAKIVVPSEISGVCQLNGLIDWNGNLYIHNESDIIPMPSGFDWVTDFHDGIAETYKGKNIGHITIENQKVVLAQVNGKSQYINLPEKYSYGIDSKNEYIQVVKDGLLGIIRADGTEIVPTDYIYIELSHDTKANLYRFICYIREEASVYDNFNGKYAIGNADIFDGNGNKLNSCSINCPCHLGYGLFSCRCEEEQIKRIKPNRNGEYEKLFLQILNSKCELISDKKFSEVLKFGESREYADSHMENENAPYAIFMRGDTWGAINTLGEIVLIGVESRLEIKDIPSLILRDCYTPNLCNIDGFKVPFKHNYKSAKYVGHGLFLVEADKSYLNDEWDKVGTSDEWDKVGTSYVDITNRALAPISGHVSEIKNNMFISYIHGDSIYLQAVIDIHGEIIIPYCNLNFEIHNNFILAKDEDYEPIIYSTHGEIIAPKGKYTNGHKFEDFLDRFIKVTSCGGWIKSATLIDLKGHELYDIYNDYYYSFEQIIPGILRIKKSYGEGTTMYLGDFHGNILSKGYEQIEVYKNGLCRVSEKRRTGYNEYNGNDTYSNFYGVIRITGEIVIPVKYRSIDVFENENVIKTSVGDMTYNGEFIAFYDSPEGQTQLILDSKYDYCLPFKGNYAIVYADNKCGIIDTLGKEIFPLICSQIVNLENDIYKIKIDSKWGIFDIHRGLVIPNRYSEINDFKNRMAIVSYEPSDNIRYYGLISLKEELIKPQYSVIRVLTPTVIAYALGGESGYAAKWILYDVNNRQPLNLDQHISFVGNYSNGLIRICISGLPCRRKHGTSISGGKWGYMDIQGRTRIAPGYEKCMDFLNGIGPVKLNGKWGFVDNSGKVIAPFDYDEIEKEDSHYIGIKKDGEKKLWYRFNEKGGIIDNGEVHPDESEGYDYDPGYDDTPSIYNNPYYNDNLDMDQQSIDFWNSL